MRCKFCSSDPQKFLLLLFIVKKKQPGDIGKFTLIHTSFTYIWPLGKVSCLVLLKIKMNRLSPSTICYLLSAISFISNFREVILSSFYLLGMKVKQNIGRKEFPVSRKWWILHRVTKTLSDKNLLIVTWLSQMYDGVVWIANSPFLSITLYDAASLSQNNKTLKKKTCI